MRTWSRAAYALGALSLLLLPVRTLAHHSHAKMPMIGVKILSPKPEAVITSNAITVQTAFTHWTLNCALAGKANKPGVGHYHILLDGSLVNMFCGAQASISMQNVTPGTHVIEVIPADNDHGDMMYMKEAKKISVVYRPTHPLPTIKPKNKGKPSITITSPRNGATVSSTFPVTVKIRNFEPSCALYGKKDLAGFGHWHLNHDSLTQGMGGMGTMLGMSCAKTFQASTAGLKPGTHRFFAILEDNQHAPLHPDVHAQVTVSVKYIPFPRSAALGSRRRFASTSEYRSQPRHRWPPVSLSSLSVAARAPEKSTPLVLLRSIPRPWSGSDRIPPQGTG